MEAAPTARLVVVGASAGGTEALLALAGALPASLPAPVVIAQHLDPTRVSHFGEILARRCALPVRIVAEREALEPGAVYVVPPNRNVEELHATNDDLEARTAELRELAAHSEAQRAHLEVMLAGLGDAVLVVDAAGRPVLANAAYERMFGDPALGIATEESEGQPLAPDQTPRARAARGESFTMEFAVPGGEEGRRWFEARGQRIEANGERQVVVVIRDVTERSLRRLQEQFLALASHELRSPLTVVHGSLSRLLPLLPADQQRARTCAELALRQSQALVRLVADLLDTARLERGQLSLSVVELNLAELVPEVMVAAQEMAEGQTIQVALPEGAIAVNGDSGRLAQVLLNLLTNAITHAAGAERIAVRLRRARNMAELEVQDHGPGIPADQLPNIFSRFYQGTKGTRRLVGLGLGLYIAREIITAHNGTLEVRSPAGEGATFIVRLPLVEEEGERPAALPATSLPDGSGHAAGGSNP